jgi:hypothetical protein
MHAAPGFFPIAIQCLCLQTLSLALLSVPCLALALLLQAMNVDVQTAGRMGEAARAAVPALIDILKDEDKDVRIQSAGALKKIDPEAARKAGVR